MEERIWRCLLDDIALDLCFEMHQQVKLDGMALDELYDVARIGRAPVDEVPTPSESQSLDVTCLRCRRQVHASRYALHLDKCMSGMRRQAANGQRPSTDRES